TYDTYVHERPDYSLFHRPDTADAGPPLPNIPGSMKPREFLRKVERRVGSWVKLMPPLKASWALVQESPDHSLFHWPDTVDAGPPLPNIPGSMKPLEFLRQVEQRIGSWVEPVPPLKVMDNQLSEPDTRDLNQSGLLFP
nr:hypothetical protein [Tanacetum cinerariifolium]